LDAYNSRYEGTKKKIFIRSELYKRVYNNNINN
jgi:hypothetical protein